MCPVLRGPSDERCKAPKGERKTAPDHDLRGISDAERFSITNDSWFVYLCRLVHDIFCRRRSGFFPEAWGCPAGDSDGNRLDGAETEVSAGEDGHQVVLIGFDGAFDLFLAGLDFSGPR